MSSVIRPEEQGDYSDFERFTFERLETELKHKFKDYLISKEISGGKRGYPHGSFIPMEKTMETGKVVEISREDAPEKDLENHPSTVLIHRNSFNEIESIEVICSCGKQTLIRLAYEDDERFSTATSDAVRDTMASTEIMNFEGLHQSQAKPKK